MLIDYSNFDNYIMRENSGAGATNRLSMQVSFAFMKIMEIYDDRDFIIVMDGIDDVAIFDNATQFPNLTTYQLKTRENVYGNFSLTTLASEGVFLKLYDHLEQINKSIREIYLVTNLPLKHKKEIVKEEKVKFSDFNDSYKDEIERDMSKSKSFSKHGISKKFVFRLIDLSIKSHRAIVKSKFLEFLENNNLDFNVRAVNAIVITVNDLLHSRQIVELSKKETIQKVVEKKGFSKKEFTEILTTTESIETIEINTIKKEYIDKMNIFEEMNYNSALGSMKSKCIDYPSELANSHRVVESFLQEKIALFSDRKNILMAMREEVFEKISSEFTDIEKEVFCMNKIEYKIRNAGD